MGRISSPIIAKLTMLLRQNPKILAPNGYTILFWRARRFLKWKRIPQLQMRLKARFENKMAGANAGHCQ
jgi:hypothetical protein